MKKYNLRPVGSLLFALCLLLFTPFFCILALLITPLPALQRYRIIAFWARIGVFAARWLCGIQYRVIGLENIPAKPFIVLSRHESVWETLIFQCVLPPVSFVLRKNLLDIPFFGTGLKRMSPIPIVREEGHTALRKIRDLGRLRLAEGFIVVTFPEGTRMAPGQRCNYLPGGAFLAKQTGVPIVPIAVNSGNCWPKNAFFKRSGLITVNIGKPFTVEDMTVEDINHKAQDWIEKELSNNE